MDRKLEKSGGAGMEIKTLARGYDASTFGSRVLIDRVSLFLSLSLSLSLFLFFFLQLAVPNSIPEHRL